MMREIESPFALEYQGKPITVSEHDIKEKRVFYIDFNGWSKPLTITVGFNKKDEKFWTSIPEGRQEEAEEIGRLIAIYIRSKNK
jgi:hypothetical protein